MKTANKTLFPSASQLSIDARVGVIEALNASLADALDLYSQVKVAHWNLKGPHFAALHPLFDTIAVGTPASDRRWKAAMFASWGQSQAVRMATRNSRLSSADTPSARAYAES